MKNCLFCTILVFCFTQICLGQEWSDLKQRHVVDPIIESYQSFRRVDWNNWYRNRTGFDGTWQNPIITILIGSDSKILSLFERENVKWTSGPNVTNDHFWSLRPTQMYVMKLQKATNDYDVYDCLESYFFVSKVDMLSRPIEIIGQAEHIGQNFTSDFSRCMPVRRNSSNSLHSMSILILTVFAILSIVSFQL